MAGCLAGGFAKGFGYLDDGLLAGLVHDLGKYSDAFQRRIRNPDHCGPVDHSTAGALLLMRHACPLAAMAVAGHHAGLPDLGSYGELEGPTFMSRMNRARRAGDCNPLALAQAGEAQLDIPQSAFLHGTRSAKPMTSSKRSERWSLYTDMMLTRMLFSALVDADRLDAEFFTSNRIDRAEHHILESLKKHLGPQNLTSGRVPAFDALREASLTVSVERDAEDRSRIDRLAAIMEEAADGYLAAPDKRPIDIRRCELLERCLACGKDPSYGTGLYTLTAPTGSGKTISSIAFALEHARTNNLRRVIYVIPYTSIIDQTVGQFEAIFGTDAVLPHYSEAPYQLKNESDMDETDLRRALAAENWNAPIVVTTAVQFFESLYSNATSRCRKLHNIADSVIVFDEAQTLPVPYLRPCVRAIAELVERYGSTAVLCTATQPELQPLFDESFDGDHVRVPEISPFTRDDRDSFRRVTIKRLGDIALDALAERLGHHKQVLCVVNTRSKAQCLHDRLAEDDAEGSFCLTTLQCAADRQRLFAEIRDRLDAGASCRVVSTSLIEAGVDVDFPVAYREEAGLDSVIQTAGRCNREGRRPVSESVVHVFSTEGGCAPFLRQNIAAFRAVADRHADLNTDEAVRAYFAEVLCLRNGGAARANVGNDALDRKRILPLHGRDANWPFADIAKRFRLIDTPTIPVYIPLPGEGSLLCERLERGDMDRTLFTDSSARFARSFVIGKIFNSRWVLERTKRDHNLRVNVERLSGQSRALSGYLKQVSGCNDVDAIRGLEGLAAKDYFYAFDDLILRSKDDFFFEQRSRRPPLDRMNALLSFSYSLLTGDCLAALQGVGLDPYVGFLHVDRPGRPSLALDLMEEFRPALADRFALTLVNLGSISAGDFEQRENGGVFLNDAGRKTVLAAWQKRKQEVITHPFLGEKMPWGLIPYVQALLLARAIRGDIDAYPPFMWK